MGRGTWSTPRTCTDPKKLELVSKLLSLNVFKSQQQRNSKIWFKKTNKHHEQLTTDEDEEGLMKKRGNPFENKEKVRKMSDDQ